MYRAGILALLVAVAACGDNRDGTCEAAGSATVTGKVKAASFAPIVSAFETRLSNGNVVIALAESGTACVDLGDGQDLALLFCDDPVSARYEVINQTDFRCPTSGAFVLFENSSGNDFADSTGGSIQIDHSGDDCIHGSYEADFAGEKLAGEFDAVVCP